MCSEELNSDKTAACEFRIPCTITPRFGYLDLCRVAHKFNTHRCVHKLVAQADAQVLFILP